MELDSIVRAAERANRDGFTSFRDALLRLAEAVSDNLEARSKVDTDSGDEVVPLIRTVLRLS